MTKIKMSDRMEMVPLKDIRPYKRNPRNNTEAVPKVAESILKFGFRNPIILDKENVVIAGHTRLLAAKKLGLKEVPCIWANDLTPDEVKALRLVDNKTAEYAEWELDLLNEELNDINLDLSAFDFDIDMATDDSEPIEVQEDDFDEETETNEHGVKQGDIWQLGRHRLMCGDATRGGDVLKLTNEETIDMVFTDPPYNVAIGSKNKAIKEVTGQKSKSITKDILNDAGMTDEEIGQSLWLPAFTNMLDAAKDNCSIYVTMPQGGTHMMMMMMMIAESGWQVKHELIWVKNSPTFSMGRLDYDYQHEPIMFGWKKNHKKIGKGQFTKSIWEIPKPMKSELHPTMKPIELISNALMNSSESNDNIMDLFGGSGSTLIACEQTNRQCYMMELDPHYCDVIISRWEKLTGQQAVKVS